MPGPFGSLLRLAVLLAAVLAPTPAEAHPFGAPQTVDVSGDDETVRVHWRVGAPDDLTVLAVSLGLVPDDRVLMDGAVAPSYADGTLLAESPRLAGYLLDTIAVRSGGAPCAGELEPVDHVGADGVTVDFTCPAPVTTAEVTVRTLTDLHTAYRTMATGPEGQKAVYSADQDTHAWSLDGATTDLGRSALLQLGLVGAIVLSVVASGFVWLRRRGRRA